MFITVTGVPTCTCSNNTEISSGYKQGKKPRKVPYYITGGRRQGEQGGLVDKSKLATFEDALACYERGSFDGIGLAMLGEWNLVGLDFDNCISNGKINLQVQGLVSGTYVEKSPSGNGIRAFMIGSCNDSRSPTAGHDFGFDIFHNKGYLTITGDILPECENGNNDIIPLTDAVKQFCSERFSSKSVSVDRSSIVDNPPNNLDDLFPQLPVGLSIDELKNLLANLDPGVGQDEARV